MPIGSMQIRVGGIRIAQQGHWVRNADHGFGRSLRVLGQGDAFAMRAINMLYTGRVIGSVPWKVQRTMSCFKLVSQVPPEINEPGICHRAITV